MEIGEPLRKRVIVPIVVPVEAPEKAPGEGEETVAEPAPELVPA